MKTLKNLLTVALITSTISLSQIIIPENSYSRGITMTSGISRTQQDPNWKNNAPNYTEEQRREKIEYYMGKLPNGNNINRGLKGLEWASQQQRNNGYVTGTGSTTEQNNREPRSRFWNKK